MGLLRRLFRAARQLESTPSVGEEEAAHAWARNALQQVFSERWSNLRDQLYLQLKEQEPALALVPRDKFSEELLAAQFCALSLVAAHTNMNLSLAATVVAEKEYRPRLPKAIYDQVFEAQATYGQKIEEYGRKNLSAFKAITHEFLQRMGCSTASAIAQRVEMELAALGQVMRDDARGFGFR